jgi:Fe-S cluster assembly protein SufB
VAKYQLFYCKSRGIALEDAINMIVSGFCKEVFKGTSDGSPVEARKLLGVSLEGMRRA